MPKKIMNSSTAKENKQLSVKKANEIAKFSKDVVFSPTVSQAKIKAKFWTKFQPGPLMSVENLTIEKVAKITDCGSIKVWWEKPGFRGWFLNQDEEREKLKYLFNKGLDSIEEILSDPTANANAKVNALKIMAEMTGYLSKNQQGKFGDDEINKMSENQLITFLEKKGVRVTQETVIDAKESKDDSAETGDDTGSDGND